MSSQLYGSISIQRKIAAGLVSIVLFGATQLSHATTTPITLQSTVGAWGTFTLAQAALDYDGGIYASSLVMRPNQTGNNGEIMSGLFWGEPNPKTGPISGLLFNPTSNGSAIKLGEAFELGTLSHYNYAIWSDTAITKADLGLQLMLAGTSPVTTGPFNFSITSSCPSSTVNATPCDDQISLSASSTQFNINGQLYSFNLLGFYKDPTTLVPNMTTTAQTANAGSLMASITSVPTTPVPAPAALWLLGSGLLGLAGFSKRKRIP